MASAAAGAGARTAKSVAIMASLPTHVEQLERVLLRRGLGALEADRDRCADCGRTPLTGEQVHLYAARQHRIVCELCRPHRRDAPVASELVRHCEHGHAVRLTVAARAA
jgi:nucleoid DNA-binding protein